MQTAEDSDMKALAFCLAAILLTSCSGHFEAKTKYPEKYYQEQWCEAVKGKAEVRLDDGTRVDCLTADFAVEVEFAHKWAESIGQAEYYALKTNRRPGVLLIMGPDDQRYLTRLQTVSTANGITIWTIGKTP